MGEMNIHLISGSVGSGNVVREGWADTDEIPQRGGVKQGPHQSSLLQSDYIAVVGVII